MVAKYFEAILLHSVSQLEKLWYYRNSACKVSVLFKKMKQGEDIAVYIWKQQGMKILVTNHKQDAKFV